MDEEVTEVRRSPQPPPTPSSRPEPVRPGAVLGHLRLESLLGRGSSGEVFQAQNLLARKACLVKVFHPALSSSRVAWGRYVHESKTVAALRQPGVADVYTHQIIEGVALAVLSPSPGKPLREALRSSGALSRRAYLPLLRAIGLALAPVHAAGIAHRRLHAGQVLVQWSGQGEPQVQLLDFGVHHLYPPITDELAELPRTPEQAIWLAPEQAKGEAGDLHSDVYALAVLLYEMMTGRPPFIGPSFKAILDQHLSEAPPPPSRFTSTPAELEEVVLRGLEKDSRKRTPSVEALLAAADPATVTGQHLLVPAARPGLLPSASKEIELSSLGPAPLPAEAASRVARPVVPAPARLPTLRLPRDRRWLFILLGVVVALCAAVLGYVFLADDPPAEPVRPPSIRRPLPAQPGQPPPPRPRPQP